MICTVAFTVAAVLGFKRSKVRGGVSRTGLDMLVSSETVTGIGPCSKREAKSVSVTRTFSSCAFNERDTVSLKSPLTNFSCDGEERGGE